MSPTAEQIHYSTETFNECSRLVHSGRVQAGIQYLMRRWRAIPESLQTRFLHAEFLLAYRHPGRHHRAHGGPPIPDA
jgi:hypothetical protein